MTTLAAMRPNATVAAGASTALGGAATVHGNLSDNSDLTGYVRLSPSSANWTKVGFDETILATKPASAVWKELVFRCRFLTHNTTAAMNWRVYENAQNIASGVVTQLLINTTVELDRTAQSGIATCEVWVYAGHVNLIDITELYLDAVYVAKPTLTVDTPVGGSTLTEDNSPLVTWTPTFDPDAGLQTKYQVKIIDDGTYGPGGDVGAMAADYDSGVLTGTATSHDIGSVALEDDTYRSYVRVANTINGNDLWSDWTAQSQFTISVPEPEVPGLTAAADNSNGRITLQLTEANAVTGTGATGSGTDWYEIERSVDAGSTWEPVRTYAEEGQLLPPRIIGATTYNDTANATTHAVNIPQPFDGSAIEAGDILLAMVGMDGSGTMTWTTGWLEIMDAAGGGSTARAGVAWLRCQGGEVGTLTVTTSSEGGGIIILLIRGAHLTTDPAIGTIATGTATTAPDATSLNPANWDVEDTLWLTMAIWNNGTGAITMTSGPSTWDDLRSAVWASVDGAGVAVAKRLERVAAMDAGAFTLSAAADWGAVSLAIRPATEGSLTLYDNEAPNGVTIQYRARTAHRFSSGTVVYSAWSSPVDTAAWTADTTMWLKDPLDPSRSVAVTFVSHAGFSRDTRVGVFQALGAPPTDAVAISDTPGPEAGETVLLCTSDSQRADLDSILGSGGVLLLQEPAGVQRYVAITSHSRQLVVDKSWIGDSYETIGWTEVTAPSGVLS